MDILLDTNILLRFCNPTASQHAEAARAVLRLLAAGETLCLASQNLIEFWAVATRPIAANGLGWTTEKTRSQIEQFLNQFQLLEDSPAIFAHWWTLVTTHNVKGKRVHDTRLVAVMMAHGITHLFTFNTDDFRRFPNIILMHPNEIS
jgi:predicted nucleic acid-binding protein